MNNLILLLSLFDQYSAEAPTVGNFTSDTSPIFFQAGYVFFNGIAQLRLQIAEKISVFLEAAIRTFLVQDIVGVGTTDGVTTNRASTRYILSAPTTGARCAGQVTTLVSPRARRRFERVKDVIGVSTVGRLFAAWCCAAFQVIDFRQAVLEKLGQVIAELGSRFLEGSARFFACFGS